MIDPRDLVLEIAGTNVSIYSLSTAIKDADLLQQEAWAQVGSRLRYGDRIMVNSRAGGRPHAFTLAVTYASKGKIKVQPERPPEG